MIKFNNKAIRFYSKTINQLKTPTAPTNSVVNEPKLTIPDKDRFQQIRTRMNLRRNNDNEQKQEPFEAEKK